MTPLELLRMAGVAAVYVLTATVGNHYFSMNGRASVFFLASGVALAALLIGGRRFFWAILLGALIKSLLAGVVWWAAAGSALGSALAALVGAWLIRRNGTFNPDLPGALGPDHRSDREQVDAGPRHGDGDAHPLVADGVCAVD